MRPRPDSSMAGWLAAGKLAGKHAVVTGGDSGIGRAVAIGFVKEGADVAIMYRDEHEDAEDTEARIREAGGRCILLPGDIGKPEICDRTITRAAEFLGGRIDILVNNAAEQHEQVDFTTISDAQIDATFRTNILAMVWITRAALPYIPQHGSIINTSSITAYRGSAELVDYAATKGAIVAFTRSLAQQLWQERQIRVNAVAPGPIWTPLIPASFDPDRVARHGASVPMQRAGQPDEVAPSFICLAAHQDSAYITGQVLHPNGGTIING